MSTTGQTCALDFEKLSRSLSHTGSGKRQLLAHSRDHNVTVTFEAWANVTTCPNLCDV